MPTPLPHCVFVSDEPAWLQAFDPDRRSRDIANGVRQLHRPRHESLVFLAVHTPQWTGSAMHPVCRALSAARAQSGSARPLWVVVCLRHATDGFVSWATSLLMPRVRERLCVVVFHEPPVLREHYMLWMVRPPYDPNLDMVACVLDPLR